MPRLGFTKGNNNSIIELIIPDEAITNESRSRVVDDHFALFRCNCAYVKRIYDLTTGVELIQDEPAFYCDSSPYIIGTHIYANHFDYNLENVLPEMADDDSIYYFTTLLPAKMFDFNPKIKTVNGLRTWTGKYYEWNKNTGKLAVSAYYLNGNLHGKYKLFHDNGQLREIRNYVHDKPHGISQLFSKYGVKLLEVNYNHGFLNGYCYAFIQHANLIINTTFIDNVCVNGNQIIATFNNKHLKYIPMNAIYGHLYKKFIQNTN